MRSALVAVCALAVALAPAPARATSCEAELEWNGDSYAGTGRAAERARVLGAGAVPGCDGPDERVTVHAVRGVAPRYAVTVPGPAPTLFVATAYPVRLSQHPLHARFYGDRRWPPCRPVGRLTVTGTLESLVDVLRLDTAAGPRTLYVDDRTRMTPAFGRLGRGDRIRVETWRCRFEGGPPTPFARRLQVVARAAPERADVGASDRELLVGVGLTAVIFGAGFAVRALRRRQGGGSPPAITAR